MSGSKIAVNKVMDERQTNVTATVESLMAAKKSTQWAPTMAPVATIFSSDFRSTLKSVLLNLKYKNNDKEAIKTLNHTNCTAEMVIKAPKIPVNPHTKTVRWRIIRFLFRL
jgi:hypothetical protein